MKSIQKMLAMVLLTTTVATATLALAEATGSAAVTDGQTYTLQQMLTYAIQDEYAARAEYAAIQAAFGEQRPFANIDGAEQTHIDALTTLFGTYGLALPADTAAIAVPATLTEAYQTGIAAENANIAMYAAFLAQTDVPDDVRAVFVALQKASENHLTAFTRSAQRDGQGLGTGQAGKAQGGGRNARQANTTAGCNMAACPLGTDTDTATQGGRNGGKGRN